MPKALKARTEITNEALKTKIKEYNDYVKKWKVENQVKNFPITLNEEKLEDCFIFTLNVTLLGGQIDLFNPSGYTVVDERPVLIHTGIESFTKRDLDFFNYLKTTFWKALTPKARENEEKQLRAYNESLKGQTDSVQVWDKAAKKTKTIARSSLKPLVLDPDIGEHYVYPKSWILKFKRAQLISETVDLHEH